MKLLFRIAIFMAAWEGFVHASKGHRRSNATKRLNVQTNRTIGVRTTHILINRTSFHILSGELHYFRLPAEYWRDRLRKLKAAGLNTVSTYVEWSYHEPEERQYRFAGDRDVAQFVRLAAEEGLHVLLRPGPYICAERDLGGLPYWLFSKYPRIRLRTVDKDFINETRIWMNKLFEFLKPLLFVQGGPIILVQVENEYDSFGSDGSYMEVIHDIINSSVGSDALLYTSDSVTHPSTRDRLLLGTLSGANLGAELHLLDKTSEFFSERFDQPMIFSEFYTGWFTTWGQINEPLNQTIFIAIFETLMSMKTRPIHINFYMFSGGTNFGHNSGAAIVDGLYKFVTTSYDYSAPITEGGDLTASYFLMKNVISKFYKIEYRNVTLFAPKGNYGRVTVRPCLRLLHPEGRVRLGKWYDSFTGAMPPTFEQLRQRAGLVLYEISILKTDSLLRIARPRDIVYVYIDNKQQGVISNIYPNNTAIFIKARSGSRLSLLVENMGRAYITDFGTPLRDDKGILSPVKINGTTLIGRWSITGFPLESMHSRACAARGAPSDLRHGPVLFQARFTLNSGTPLDTFLYPAGWGKGYVWLNGHNLGRYWLAEGPQLSLYVPGVWLKEAPAINTLHIIELEYAPNNLTVTFVDSFIM